MGNCFSLNEPLRNFRKKRVEFRKAVSRAAKPHKVSCETSNVINVPAASNVTSVPVTSNVVDVPVATNAASVPATSNVVNKPVTSDVASVPVTSNAASVPLANNVGSVPVSSNKKNVPVVRNVTSVPVTNNAGSVPVASFVAETPVTSNSICPSTINNVTAVPKNVDNFQQIISYENVSIFTYQELCLATHLFRPDLILGEGGFGLVYKGVIDESIRPGFKSTVVAVKELNPNGYQGDREWLAEVNYLGQFRHPNLVKLIGYCCEGQHRLLVYEYMACGSLESHLFRRRHSMPWSTRMKIALDAAKGLAFLHGAERPIIYRDFKTSNILLDAEFKAKLSDFGLAKEGPVGDQTHVSTRVMGTYGYAAPEYIMTGHLTARSDVYSFGVVLLEMLIGKRALDRSRPNQEHNLVEWARPLLIRNTKLLRIIDPRMQGQYSSKISVRIGNLAHRCLSENPKWRPTMSEVVESLETYIQEEMVIQSCRAAVAIQGASNEALDCPAAAEEKKHQSGNNAEEAKRESTVHGRRRIKAGNGRSRSDPPLEFDCPYSPSSDSEQLSKLPKSAPNDHER